MNASARVAVMADPFAFCSSSSVAPIGQPLAPKTLDLLRKVRVEEGLVRPGPESFVVGKQRRCHGGRKGPCSGLHGPDECRKMILALVCKRQRGIPTAVKSPRLAWWTVTRRSRGNGLTSCRKSYHPAWC